MHCKFIKLEELSRYCIFKYKAREEFVKNATYVFRLLYLTLIYLMFREKINAKILYASYNTYMRHRVPS